jgi:triosephosphate isomerase
MSSSIRPFFCGNWKLFGTIAESVALATGVRDAIAGVVGAEVAVAPGFVALVPVIEQLRGGPVGVSAQNCHFEAKGAFTGEVAPAQLADIGCKYVIVGHSERRQLFGETDAGVAKKTRAVLAAGLSPIVCVGETLAQRDANQTLQVIATQLEAAVLELAEAELLRCVIAYEPVWAIGTGRNATDPEAQEVQLFVRDWLAKNANRDFADRVRIIYGGSMKPENAQGLMEQADVDGGLIGGASLKPDSFLAICKTAGSWYEKEKAIGRN